MKTNYQYVMRNKEHTLFVIVGIIILVVCGLGWIQTANATEPTRAGTVTRAPKHTPTRAIYWAHVVNEHDNTTLRQVSIDNVKTIVSVDRGYVSFRGCLATLDKIEFIHGGIVYAQLENCAGKIYFSLLNEGGNITDF